MEKTASDKPLCGIDEAGRGPLAGPVTAGCVILPLGFPSEMAQDSKKMSPRDRLEAAQYIIDHAVAWGLGWANVAEIERWNILQAALLAMRRAYHAMLQHRGGIAPALVFVDGNKAPELPVPAETVIGGDALVPAIGAASILAKTARDRWMERWSWIEPQYGFENHKGYGTKAHVEHLLKFGPGGQHRPSFLKKILGGS